MFHPWTQCSDSRAPPHQLRPDPGQLDASPFSRFLGPHAREIPLSCLQPPRVSPPWRRHPSEGCRQETRCGSEGPLGHSHAAQRGPGLHPERLSTVVSWDQRTSAPHPSGFHPPPPACAHPNPSHPRASGQQPAALTWPVTTLPSTPPFLLLSRTKKWKSKAGDTTSADRVRVLAPSPPAPAAR